MGTPTTQFLLFGFCIALVPGLFAQNPDPGDPRHEYLGELRGQVATFNYDSVLDKALKKDPIALAHLFRLGALDGAGAEAHSQVLWALLFRWGDSSYAAVLRAEPDSVRKRIGCNLDSAAGFTYANQFPATFKAVTHNPTCRDWKKGCCLTCA